MDTLRITYSGRISAGRLKRTDYEQEKTPVPPDREYWSLVFSVHGFTEALRLRQTLGLSNLANSPKSSEGRCRVRRGLKGLSGKGQVKVRDSVQWMEDRIGRGLLSFWTLTIPQENLTEALVAGWSKIVKNLVQWLSYQLHRAGVNPQIVGVTEVQKPRQSGPSHIPALHLHIVFQGRCPGGGWIVSKQSAQKYWHTVLEKWSGREPQSDCSSRLERVRKSCVAYLGKYLSKGVKDLSPYKPELLPTSWYICTLNLRRAVNKAQLYFTGEQARELYEYIIKNKRILRFSKLVNITTNDGRNIPVGWFGQVYDRFQYWQLYEFAIEFRDAFNREPLIGISTH